MKEPKIDSYFRITDWLIFAIISILHGINKYGFTWSALFEAWVILSIIVVVCFVVVAIIDLTRG